MKPSLKTTFIWSMSLAAAFTVGCAHVGKPSGPISRAAMSRRCVQQVGENESVALGQAAVAVAGNGGKAKTHEWGAAVTGDGGGALVSKGGVVLAGDTGCASVGDGGMAMTGYRGHADGYWLSAAMVHAAGHAVVDHQSVAMATGGVAEVRQHGVAVAGSFRDSSITTRGIAVAGNGGIALAWGKRRVCAGRSGRRSGRLLGSKRRPPAGPPHGGRRDSAGYVLPLFRWGVCGTHGRGAAASQKGFCRVGQQGGWNCVIRRKSARS